LVYQRGLAMIYMGNDCDVTKSLDIRHGNVGGVREEARIIGSARSN